MTMYKALIPEVRTHVAGAPEVEVLLYLRRAAKQFCQDTKVWDVLIGSADVSPDPDGYRVVLEVPSPAAEDQDFTLPAMSVLNTISKVWLGDARDEDEPLDAGEYEYDRATRELAIARRVISEDTQIYVKAILEPTKAATAIPDWIGELWSEGIVSYAIFELMSMPAKEWTNPGLAGVFKNKYDRRVEEATVDKARKGTRKAIRMKPKPFV